MGLKGDLLRSLLARRGELIAGTSGAQAREDLRVVRETRARTELLVQDVSALLIMACVRAASAMGAPMAEAGVFRGGTARLICAAKGRAALHLFDVFETLQDGAGDALGADGAREVHAYFGAFHAPASAVVELLADYRDVHVHAGLFPASAAGLDGTRFSFVHLDLDLESGTRAALEFFHPRLLPGGILIGDDYNLPSVRRAFDGHFAGRSDQPIALPWGQALVVRTEP